LPQIANRLPSSANRVIAALVDFIDHDVDYVKSETVVVMQGNWQIALDLCEVYLRKGLCVPHPTRDRALGFNRCVADIPWPRCGCHSVATPVLEEH
jgi:hypothetical protein